MILGYPPSLISLGSRAQPDFKGYFSISATDFVAALTLKRPTSPASSLAKIIASTTLEVELGMAKVRCRQPCQHLITGCRHPSDATYPWNAAAHKAFQGWRSHRGASSDMPLKGLSTVAPLIKVGRRIPANSTSNVEEPNNIFSTSILDRDQIEMPDLGHRQHRVNCAIFLGPGT